MEQISVDFKQKGTDSIDCRGPKVIDWESVDRWTKIKVDTSNH